MAQKVPFTNKNFQNCFRGLQDTSQKADFERESTLVHPYHINIKVVAKGLDWCYIGENWWKLAELG